MLVFIKKMTFSWVRDISIPSTFLLFKINFIIFTGGGRRRFFALFFDFNVFLLPFKFCFSATYLFIYMVVFMVIVF